jgi:hypothetical protein
MLARIHSLDRGHGVLVLTHLVDLGHPLEDVIYRGRFEGVTFLHMND